MNALNKIATAFVLSFGIAATATANPMGPHGTNAQQGPGHGMQSGMGPGPHHGMMGAMQHRMSTSQAAQQLMTAEERSAIQERMRSATTPEERQQIAVATRTEMQKRSAEKGVALPDHVGPHRRAMGSAGVAHKH